MRVPFPLKLQWILAKTAFGARASSKLDLGCWMLVWSVHWFQISSFALEFAFRLVPPSNALPHQSPHLSPKRGQQSANGPLSDPTLPAWCKRCRQAFQAMCPVSVPKSTSGTLPAVSWSSRTLPVLGTITVRSCRGNWMRHVVCWS